MYDGIILLSMVFLNTCAPDSPYLFYTLHIYAIVAQNKNSPIIIHYHSDIDGLICLVFNLKVVDFYPKRAHLTNLTSQSVL